MRKKSKAVRITITIKQIGAKQHVGDEWLRIQLQLYETCLLTSLIYGLEGWPNNRGGSGKIRADTRRAIKKYFTCREINTIYRDTDGNRSMANKRNIRI